MVVLLASIGGFLLYLSRTTNWRKMATTSCAASLYRRALGIANLFYGMKTSTNLGGTSRRRQLRSVGEWLAGDKPHRCQSINLCRVRRAGSASSAPDDL